MSKQRSMTRRAALGLIGVGGLLTATTTYSRTVTNADRVTDLTVVDDPSAYLGLDGHGDVAAGEPRDDTLTVLNNTNTLDLEITVSTTDFAIGGEGGSYQRTVTLGPTDSEELSFFPEDANQDDVEFVADILSGGSLVGTIDVTRTVTIPFQDGQVYRIESVHNENVLDVAGGSNQNGANVVHWAYDGNSWQEWEVVAASDGTYRLEPQRANNKALGVAGGSEAEGASLVQRQWTNGNQGPDRRWNIESNGDGSYRLVNQKSGYVADVADWGVDNDNVIQYGWNDQANQKWIFKPV